MWWSGEDDEGGGSSSDNTTPPVDIMAEESELSSSVMSDMDLPDFKEQFAIQESLLGKLTNALKSNEEKLQMKEKEVQVAYELIFFILISLFFISFSGLCH